MLYLIFIDVFEKNVEFQHDQKIFFTKGNALWAILASCFPTCLLLRAIIICLIDYIHTELFFVDDSLPIKCMFQWSLFVDNLLYFLLQLETGK